ncbi:MAG: hypothetical protein JNL73_14830 [Anaerolineales bacterium]|nr:hypothetical protein [Anaerolineales bacterium]
MNGRWVHSGLTYMVTAALIACAPARAPIDPPVAAPTPDSPRSTQAGYPGVFTPDVVAYPMVIPTQDVPATLTAMASTPRPSIADSTLTPPSKVPEYILEGAFIDSSHGWLLGLSAAAGQSRYDLAATTDGGETWTEQLLPDDPYDTDWWNQAHVFFADPMIGWVTYPGTVLSTADGGASWTTTVIPGVIRTLARATDGTLWALEERWAEGVVWHVTGPAYGDWQDLEGDLPMDLRQGANLVLLDAQEWWLSGTSLTENGSMAPQWLASGDGGQSWAERTLPCEDPRLQVGAFIALSPERVWVLCSAVWTSVESLKAVYVTSDSGGTWALRGRALGAPVDTLSSAGLIGSFGALSDDFVFMALNKTARIELTHDGGTTWFSVPAPCAIDFIQATFIDQDIGWAYGGGCVARTVDGGLTWTCRWPEDGAACASPDRPGPLGPP